MKFDKGNVEQTISVVFPENSRISNTETPQERNPDLMSFRIGTVVLKFYYKDDKGWIYDCDGIYCGSFAKHDLKNAFSRLGAILKAVRKKKGYSTV